MSKSSAKKTISTCHGHPEDHSKENKPVIKLHRLFCEVGRNVSKKFQMKIMFYRELGFSL